jgi:acetyltransferase-like isoleucine patch superfamily enzyme
MSYLLKIIKRKITDTAIRWTESFNRIDEKAKIHPSAYIKSSKLFGAIIIAEGVKLYKTEISGKVEIGRYTSLWGPGIHLLSGINPIKIGNFCSIARNLTIQEYFHDYSKLTTYYIGRNVFGNNIKNEIVSKGSVIIGHDVWIGVNVTVLSGLTIGNGVVIGAGSVITKDVPPFAIVGGSPARIIKYRFSKERIEELEQLKWWDWNLERIKENRKLFE